MKAVTMNARLIKLGDRSRPPWKTSSEFHRRTISASTTFCLRTVCSCNRFPGADVYGSTSILLEITFIAGRSKDERLRLLEAINERVVSAVGISPDDLSDHVLRNRGRDMAFGRGEAERAHIGVLSMITPAARGSITSKRFAGRDRADRRRLDEDVGPTRPTQNKADG